MKKLLGLTLALVLATPAFADVLKNVELKGEIQTIASDVRQNPSLNPLDPAAPGTYNSGTNLRVLAGLSFDVVEDVRSNVLFQYGNMWGSNAPAVTGAGTPGANLDSYWNKVTLVEVNVVLSNLFDRFEATVGRQFYGDEDSAVMYFGPTHYNAEGLNLANSLDAVKVTYGDEDKSFTMIAGKTAFNEDVFMFDDPYNAAADRDVAIYGADFRTVLTETVKFQAYGYDLRNWQSDPSDPGTFYKNAGFYGTKLTLAPEGFTFSGEYARNFAGSTLVREPKNTGYMAKFDLALHADSVTPRAAFVYSNGFVGFGNYRPGLLVGDLARGQIFDYGEATFNTGLRLFNVGVDFKSDKWTFAIDGYSFQDRTAHTSGTLEADVTVKYAHNQYVELFAGVGYAKYGSGLKDTLGKDNTKGQLGLLLHL